MTGSILHPGNCSCHYLLHMDQNLDTVSTLERERVIVLIQLEGYLAGGRKKEEVIVTIQHPSVCCAFHSTASRY